MKSSIMVTIAIMIAVFNYSCGSKSGEINSITEVEKTFIVQPINSMSEFREKVLKLNLSNKLFTEHSKNYLPENFDSFPNPSPNSFEKAEIITCSGSSPEEILREIKQRGYKPLPAPYLLDLIITHSDSLKEYTTITSLDVSNQFQAPSDHNNNLHPCVIVISFCWWGMWDNGHKREDKKYYGTSFSIARLDGGDLGFSKGRYKNFAVVKM